MRKVKGVAFCGIAYDEEDGWEVYVTDDYDHYSAGMYMSVLLVKEGHRHQWHLRNTLVAVRVT